MSRRNGDRARFQKDRKRKLRHRQRIQAFMKVRSQALTPAAGLESASLPGALK